jgi:hypothetical protein
MVNISHHKSNKNAAKFADLVVNQRKSQVDAYSNVYPDASRSSANARACVYARTPLVQEYIEKAVSEISEKDTGKITNAIVNDAIRAKVDVIYNSDGDTKKIDNASLTIAAREQFFKLAGHPGFIKQTNINIDQRQVNLTVESADKLAQSIDRLTSNSDVMVSCDQQGAEPT